MVEKMKEDIYLHHFLMLDQICPPAIGHNREVQYINHRDKGEGKKYADKLVMKEEQHMTCTLHNKHP